MMVMVKLKILTFMMKIVMQMNKEHTNAITRLPKLYSYRGLLFVDLEVKVRGRFCASSSPFSNFRHLEIK